MNARFIIAGNREAGAGCPHCSSPVTIGDPVAACAACGTIHHRSCFEQRGGCGAYACAPARRQVGPASGSAWKISPDELTQVTPIPPRQVHYPHMAVPIDPPRPRGRWNKLAIVAIAVALIGLTPLGLVVGLIAVILGALALSAAQQYRQRGSGLAIGAMGLGLADVAVWAVVIALWMGGFGGGVPIRLNDFTFNSADLEGVAPEIGQAMRANVLIQSRKGLARGIGSGVILKIAGGEALVLTNRHVVDNGFEPGDDKAPILTDLPELEIMMIGQAIERGRVTWLAPGGIDLALIAVPIRTTEAVAAKWARHIKPAVGQDVFAIGNPQELGWTHTKGSVSQFRTWTLGGHALRIIQTSAPINPGNSGGGLYNDKGYLIGINTMTADKRVGEGLGFAIAFEAFLGLNPPGVTEPAGRETAPSLFEDEQPDTPAVEIGE